MARSDLINAFKDRTVLPIDLNEVRQWLLDRGIQNRIEFIGVELEPTGAIRGFLKRFKDRKGGWEIEPDEVSHIYYETRQGLDWQNMTCAKELIHILDAACVTSKAAFDKLTQSLALPDDLRYLLKDPDFALVDKWGTAPACALLLPLAARELLLPAYDSRILTPSEIAKLAGMPTEHVRTVMSPSWPAIHDLILMNDGV
jgi:hypothetical protein